MNDSIKYYEDYLEEFPDDEVTKNLLYQIKMRAIDALNRDKDQE